VNRPSDQRVTREGESDDEILPVLWQDNYFALLPGEPREVTATFRMQQKDNTMPTVAVDGWNVKHTMVGVQQ
jgi:exo-1,4-beta-D-glucosaminidase